MGSLKGFLAAVAPVVVLWGCVMLLPKSFALLFIVGITVLFTVIIFAELGWQSSLVIAALMIGVGALQSTCSQSDHGAVNNSYYRR